MDIEKLFEKIPYESIYPIPAWQRLGAIFGVSILLMSAFYFLLIQGMDDDINQLEKNLAAIQKQVADNRLHAQKLGKLKEKIIKLEAEMNIASELLPTKKEIPELLEQVSNIGTQVGLDFVTFKPRKDVTKDFYVEVPVKMVVRGKFHSVMMFFDAIAHLKRIVTVGNINIKKQKKSTMISMECLVSAYRFVEKVDKKKRNAAKGGKKMSGRTISRPVSAGVLATPS